MYGPVICVLTKPTHPHCATHVVWTSLQITHRQRTTTTCNPSHDDDTSNSNYKLHAGATATMMMTMTSKWQGGSSASTGHNFRTLLMTRAENHGFAASFVDHRVRTSSCFLIYSFILISLTPSLLCYAFLLCTRHLHNKYVFTHIKSILRRAPE